MSLQIIRADITKLNVDAIVNATNYHNDSEGVELNFRTISQATMMYRARKAIPDDWKKDIDEDLKKRK